MNKLKILGVSVSILTAAIKKCNDLLNVADIHSVMEAHQHFFILKISDDLFTLFLSAKFSDVDSSTVRPLRVDFMLCILSIYRFQIDILDFLAFEFYVDRGGETNFRTKKSHSKKNPTVHSGCK